MGHMSVVPSSEAYFIPHYLVFNIIIRVLFDVSASNSSNRSLNQCLLTRQKLQQVIVDILLGFRVHRFTFTADIDAKCIGEYLYS